MCVLNYKIVFTPRNTNISKTETWHRYIKIKCPNE